MSTKPHSPKIYLNSTKPSHKMYPCNGIYPKCTVLINVWKCPRTTFNTIVPFLHIIKEKKVSISEPILRLIATLTRDHCSYWKKCNFFVPKIDSSANRNFAMQTFISDTHIFRVGINYLRGNQIETFTLK